MNSVTSTQRWPAAVIVCPAVEGRVRGLYVSPKIAFLLGSHVFLLFTGDWPSQISLTGPSHHSKAQQGRDYSNQWHLDQIFWPEHHAYWNKMQTALFTGCSGNLCRQKPLIALGLWQMSPISCKRCDPLILFPGETAQRHSCVDFFKRWMASRISLY